MVEARTRAMVGLAPKTDVARRRQRMPCYLPPPAVTRALELSQRQACAGRAGGRCAQDSGRRGRAQVQPLASGRSVWMHTQLRGVLGVCGACNARCGPVESPDGPFCEDAR